MKVLISSIIGFGVGITCGFFLGKRLERKKQMASEGVMDDYYKRVEHYKKSDDQNEDEEVTVKSSEEEKKARKDYIKNGGNKEKVPYDKMYKTGYAYEDDFEAEVPKEEHLPLEAEAAHDRHQRDKNKKPKIISFEDAMELNNTIESETLYFYSYDEVLCEENGDVIEDPGLFVGDCLEKYGFVQNDEEAIYVMNYELDTCFEVVKKFESYEVEHGQEE